MPRLMPDAVLDAIPAQLSSLSQTQQTLPTVVLHGGEPLLLGHRKIRKLVEDCISLVPNAAICIQSNGTIYTKELEQLFLDFPQNLFLSLSIDGDKSAQDRHRLRLKGTSSHSRVNRTAQLATSAGILSQVLVVVDTRNSPESIIEFMKACGAPSYNLLLLDGDYDTLPANKNDVLSTETGQWLWQLFLLYATTGHSFKIKFFDDISIAILKQVRKIKTPKPTYSLCTMTVDTNGEIKQIDTLRSNFGNKDHLCGQNILDTELGTAANSAENVSALIETEKLCNKCLDCESLDVCGGGYPPHRASNGNYLNPSIYCSDYLHLFARIRKKICT